MSSTRVMGTTSLMGQAVGTAAAIAVRNSLTPRGIYEHKLAELQQTLMDDDSWLPWRSREVSAICRSAKLTAPSASPEPLRNGIDRSIGDVDNGWTGKLGDAIEYRFDSEVDLSEARITFDSDLNRTDPSRRNGQGKLLNMRYYRGLHDLPFSPPATLVRDFRIETRNADGTWQCVAHHQNNFQRLVRTPLTVHTKGVRFIAESTWGAEMAHLFAFEVK